MQSVEVFVGGYGILPYPRHPLKSSHGIHRIHRSFWCRIFSHRFHRCSQIFRLRYWRRGYGRMPYPPNLCASVPICGRLSSPDGSVCSACSVGHSLCLLCWCCRGRCTSVVVFSHGFHGFPQKLGCVIGGVGMAGCHTLLIRAYLWEALLCQTVLYVPRVLWGICTLLCWCSFVGALETSAPPKSAP